MTEFEKQLLERLERLEMAVTDLRSEFSISQITYFENLSPFAVVGIEYAAYRFGCSQDAVIRGRFETDKIVDSLVKKHTYFLQFRVAPCFCF